MIYGKETKVATVNLNPWLFTNSYVHTTSYYQVLQLKFFSGRVLQQCFRWASLLREGGASPTLSAPLYINHSYQSELFFLRHTISSVWNSLQRANGSEGESQNTVYCNDLSADHRKWQALFQEYYQFQ